ncbi:MAG: outer membrane lipoprotein-sorting protein [Nitrospirae bacterium]|nr:outer membrane lipoprotein-sorting protein [Candidatus Manganitrophaceae bacterium]
MTQNILSSAFLLVSLLVLPPLSLADDESPAKPVPSAEAILKASNKRIYELKDQTSQVTFRLVNTDGTEKKTVMRLYWKNYFGKDNINSKTLLVTESPAHDKGEKYLLWERPEEKQADIWLYLPELRQVRRLQSGGHHHHDKEDDSELVFEDMHQRPLERDEHKLLADEEVRGEPCYVIETHFKDHPLYSKKTSYISKKEGTVRRIDYFSDEGKLLKTQWIEWQQVGESLVWKGSEVVNAQTSRKTFVELSNVKVNVGLSEDQFSERALRQ